MAGRVLSVDYGSSSTVAALRDPDGRGRLLLFDSSPLLASAVCADADGALVGGQEARHLARVHPERYEPTPKRRIGQPELLLGDRAYPVVEAVAVTLRLVAAAAIEAAGASPDAVTVTHPAGWPAARRAVLVDAAQRAGLPAPVLLPEPVAAAGYFRSRPDCPPGPLVVYDLGAGTCDVSVVADDGTVLAVDGIDDLGGADLDELVVSMVAEAVPDGRLGRWRAMTAPATGSDRRYFRLLWDDARAARELLSRRAGTHLHLPALELDVPIGRERFEQAARPLLMRSAGLAAGLIGRAGTAPRELAGIVLVGGASRTPLVATLLHQTLGVAPTMLDQPELVVAQGGLLVTQAPVGGPAAPAARGGAIPAGEPIDAMRPAPEAPGAAPGGAGIAATTAFGDAPSEARIAATTAFGGAPSEAGIAATSAFGAAPGGAGEPAGAGVSAVGPAPVVVSGAVPTGGAAAGAGPVGDTATGIGAPRAVPVGGLARGGSGRPVRTAPVDAGRWPWWASAVVVLLGLTVLADVVVVLGRDARLPAPIAAAALVVGGYAVFDTARRAEPGRLLNRLAAVAGALLAAAVLACPLAYLVYGDDDQVAGFLVPLPFLVVCGVIAALTARRGGGDRGTARPVAVLGTALLYGASSAAVFVVVAVEDLDDPGLAEPARHIVLVGLVVALLATAGLVAARRSLRSNG